MREALLVCSRGCLKGSHCTSLFSAAFLVFSLLVLLKLQNSQFCLFCETFRIRSKKQNFQLVMRNATGVKVLLCLVLLFLDVLSDAQVSMAPMEKAERETMYTVIQGFVGEGWNGSELYPDPCGWTMIQGISCDFYNGFWYITEISIGPVLENSLECAPDAKFSPLLFELKHLKTLSFFNCFTSSSVRPTTIPSQDWNKLGSSLETLEFRSNQGLIGEIPSMLGQLTNLNSLVLVNNALTGELPQELAKLVHLKRLVLSGNRLSGRIPTSLGSNNDMDELLILDLSRNSLTGPLPPSLGGLTSLIKLDLSYNLFDGTLPNELGKLKNLTLLDLKANNFYGGLTQSLQEMASLQDMLLSNNPLGGNIMSFRWENLKELTTLDISNAGLDGSIPESIAGLTNLRFLALADNHLSGSVPSKLAALPWLNALYLNGNNLTGVLEFPESFYERMGRRFASWGNPKLCYGAEVLSSEHAPWGVEHCKHEQEVPVYSSDPNVSVGNSDQSSSYMAPFGFSSSSSYGICSMIIVQEAVVVSILLLIL